MGKVKDNRTKLKHLKWQLNKVMGCKQRKDGTWPCQNQPIYVSDHMGRDLMTLRGRIQQRILTINNTK